MKKRLYPYEIAVLLLFAVWLVTDGITFAVAGRKWGTVLLLITLLCGIACGLYLFLRRSQTAAMLRTLGKRLSPLERRSLEKFPMPVLVFDGNMMIRWYNDSAASFFNGERATSSARELFRGYSDDWEDTSEQSVNIDGKGYTVYAERFNAQGEQMTVLYCHDDDELKRVSAEYYNTRPVVMIVTIDNYEELLKEARDLEKTKILAGVEETILHWVTRTSGMLLRYEREKYIFLVEERDFRRLRDDKFDILDDVRKQVRPDGTYPTLSIGVGHGYDSYRDSEKAARQALDMALGRGGDQAAVSTGGDNDVFEFYGGVTKGVERNSKVRTRVVSASLENLIKQSSRVLIVGHARSDMDSVGAAVGVQFIAVGLGKEARCVVNRETSLAANLIKYVEEGGLNIFLSPAQAKKYMDNNTLVVVVDNQKITTVDAPEVVEGAKYLAIVDHHRRAADSIENPDLLFNEPNSSSASEMVVELIQYMSCGKPNKVQSEALLAGIILDTKTFTSNTGVRTFEAAAYLRRRGVDTAVVKQMFAEPFETYVLKNKFLGNLYNYHSTAFAIVTEPLTVPYANKSASLAADELAAIDRIEASFALYTNGEQTAICARSSGALNVQLVMERLGGGGHHNMAGAQLRNTGIDEAVTRLKYAIDQVMIEARQQQNAANNEH